MSVEHADLEALGRELGDALAETPAHRRFEEAKAAVENDDEAQEKIAEFERLRDEFNVARGMGKATQEDVERLETLQSELHSLPVMEEYLNAQEALQRQLEAINEAISEPLAVDFGGEAGGCCQD
ncbi:MAG: YlbF family regulator [Haloplanus sp.]